MSKAGALEMMSFRSRSSSSEVQAFALFIFCKNDEMWLIGAKRPCGPLPFPELDFAQFMRLKRPGETPTAFANTLEKCC